MKVMRLKKMKLKTPNGFVHERHFKMSKRFSYNHKNSPNI